MFVEAEGEARGSSSGDFGTHSGGFRSHSRRPRNRTGSDAVKSLIAKIIDDKMECDLEITRGKLRSAAEALFKKECLLEEVVAGIKRCETTTWQAWGALQHAFSGMQCGNIKGRVGSGYIEIPLLDGMAAMVVDVIGVSLDFDSDEMPFLPPKPHQGAIAKVLKRRHVDVQSMYKGLNVGDEVNISIGNLEYDDGTFWLKLNIRAEGVKDTLEVELARIEWSRDQ